MKIHAFFFPFETGIPKPGERLIVSDDTLVHQWSRVLRFQAGEEVFLFDGKGSEVVRVTIETLMSKQAEVSVIAVAENKAAMHAMKRNVQICMAIIKGDRFEWAVQKCAELGVMSFQPIVTERTIKKDVNIERLQSIAKEACEQSMRANMMVVEELVSLEEAICKAKDGGRGVISCSTESDANPVNISEVQAPAIFIGPEGGFTDQEELLIKGEGETTSLGFSVLRAETAAVTAAVLSLQTI